jgi:hypothetical protein
MTELKTEIAILGRNYPVFAVFSLFLFIVLGCSLSKFVPASNGSTSNTTTSDKKTSDTSAPIATLCNNGYYPVGPSVVRKYHVSYPKGMLSDREYTESFSDFAGDTFTVNTDFGTVNAHVHWRCTPDGLLATQYNNSIDLMKSGASAKVDTVDSSGVTFPPQDRWQTGEKWQAEYHVVETLNGPDGKSMGGGDGTVKQDGEIVGSESVIVPAGSFETMKVQIKTDLDITIKMKGMSIPMKVPFETTAWFAKDTGMVKAVTKLGQGGNTTTELTSINK